MNAVYLDESSSIIPTKFKEELYINEKLYFFVPYGSSFLLIQKTTGQILMKFC